MSDYHEPSQELAARDRDLHRALTSLKEEIEAVDWYHQRVVLTEDSALKKVLEHNRDEEIEHASMTLEWLRRRMPAWQEHLSTYLFTEAGITEIEDEAESGERQPSEEPASEEPASEEPASEEPHGGSSETALGLGIGGLRQREVPR